MNKVGHVNIYNSKQTLFRNYQKTDSVFIYITILQEPLLEVESPLEVLQEISSDVKCMCNRIEEVK